MKTKILELILPTMIGGKLENIGAKIEVTLSEASDLIARGRAIVATIEADLSKAATVVGKAEKAVAGAVSKLKAGA